MSEQANVEVSQEMEQFISYVEKLSVLELSKLVKALGLRSPLLRLRLLPVRLLPLLLKSRLNSRSFSPMPAPARSTSSRKSAPSPVSVSKTPRISLKPLRRLSKKAFPKKTLRRSRSSLRLRVPRSRSSNCLASGICIKT